MRHVYLGLAVISFGLSAMAVPPSIGTAAEMSPQAKRSLAVVPAEEQRSRIVKVIGSVPIPDAMKPTPSPAQLDELRNEAVQQAKKSALERARQDLAAGSGAAGWSVRQPTLGDVYIIQLVALPAETDRVSLVMAAEVRFALEKASAGPAPGGTSEASPAPPSTCEADACLTARVSTDNTVYTVGEQVIIRLAANRDFYGVVYYEDVTGKQIQVLPNAFRSENFFKGGTEYVIPGEGDKFKLVVMKPVGTETIRLRASPQPLPLEAIPAMADGRKTVDVPPHEAALLTRSLMVMAAEPAAEKTAPMPSAEGKSAQLNEATWELETKLGE